MYELVLIHANINFNATLPTVRETSFGLWSTLTQMKLMLPESNGPRIIFPKTSRTELDSEKLGLIRSLLHTYKILHRKMCSFQ